MIGRKLIDRIEWWLEYNRGRDTQINGRVSPGNNAGGLANVLEKSLGGAKKGGNAPLMDVYEYAYPVKTRGLVFMDTPGYDPVSATGQIAGGANMIAFTTGRGSCFGSVPAPTFKLASNSPMYNRMAHATTEATMQIRLPMQGKGESGSVTPIWATPFSLAHSKTLACSGATPRCAPITSAISMRTG